MIQSRCMEVVAFHGDVAPDALRNVVHASDPSSATVPFDFGLKRPSLADGYYE